MSGTGAGLRGAAAIVGVAVYQTLHALGTPRAAAFWAGE